MHSLSPFPPLLQLQINLVGNQLTGGIPEEWTRLGSLAVMSEWSPACAPRRPAAPPRPRRALAARLRPARTPQLWALRAAKGGVPPARAPRAGLQDNRLSGTLPAAMAFNQSFQLNVLSVNGNNFSGRVPSWPDQPLSQIGVRPGNPGLCGEVRLHAACARTLAPPPRSRWGSGRRSSLQGLAA